MLCVHHVSAGLARKQLAGLPSEFENHRIPNPSRAAVTSESAEHPFFVDLATSEEGEYSAGFHMELPVDSAQLMMFTVFSPHEEQLELNLVDPNGNKVNLAKHAQATHYPLSDDTGAGVKGTAYVFEQPIVGVYKLDAAWGTHGKSLSEEEVTILRSALSKKTNPSTPDGIIMLYNESPESVHSQLQTYALVQGQTVGVNTRAYDNTVFHGDVRVGVPEALKDSVTSAELDVEMPDGTEIDIPMHDDGEHGDLLGNDGVWGAQVTATEVGQYVLRTVVRGKNNAGNDFVRTTQQLVTVVPDSVKLTGNAWANMRSLDNRLEMNLEITDNFDRTRAFRVYAEVYGTSVETKEEVAVAWVGTLADTQINKDGKRFLTVELDAQWIERAKAMAPFVLKNAYVAELTAHVPLSHVARIPVNMGEMDELKMAQALVDLEYDGLRPITKEMRNGVAPVFNNTATAGKKGLVMVHGYCSAENPWEAKKHQFPDAAFFLNPSASETNDRFAQMVGEFGDSKFESFGIIGHSQGGLVSLHLHNFYHTGLERASGGKLIQSLGSPYYGCSGAGSAANLIKAFGVGCGANQDLTRDGSELWMTGITQESRKDVSYYTTQYKTGGLVNYCNIAVNLVLKWPNDGTTERQFSELNDASNMGHVKGQCHTTNMKSAPQYWDESRNSVMNAAAAR